MSLNVNYTSLYKNGIDTSVLKDVSQEILRRAAQKSSQYQVSNTTTHQVNSIAKPVELGVDLYQGKVETNVQKRIAMNNSFQYQFNEATLNSIKYLNSQAATAISKKVDGKYMPVVNEVIVDAPKAAETTSPSRFMSIFSAAASKDKDGSNPFYNGELLMGKSQSQKEEKNETESLKSIFA